MERNSSSPETRQKSRADYTSELTRHLKRNDPDAAYLVVKEALKIYTSDLFFLSCYGFVLASVEERHEEGTAICREAVQTLRRTTPLEMGFLYPFFYLNWGRSCVLNGNRSEAIDAFYEGLRFDRKNRELLAEARALGFRRRPVVPFLGRGNPVNKILGKIRHTLSKA